MKNPYSTKLVVNNWMPVTGKMAQEPFSTGFEAEICTDGSEADGEGDFQYALVYGPTKEAACARAELFCAASELLEFAQACLLNPAVMVALAHAKIEIPASLRSAHPIFTNPATPNQGGR